MNKYETVEVKHWAEGEVYCYYYKTGEEVILQNTYTTQIIKTFNEQEYFISATYIEHGKVVYIMTKIIK